LQHQETHPVMMHQEHQAAAMELALAVDSARAWEAEAHLPVMAQAQAHQAIFTVPPGRLPIPRRVVSALERSPPPTPWRANHW
jgi:hypothetical protein